LDSFDKSFRRSNEAIVIESLGGAGYKFHSIKMLTFASTGNRVKQISRAQKLNKHIN